MASTPTYSCPGDGIKLVDTHCHLDCEPLYSSISTILDSARRAGVVGCVTPGVHPAHWERIAMLAQEHKGVFAAFGIHPMHADLADEAALDRLKGFAGGGLAIGEIGLDSCCSVSQQQQEQAFRDQLRLAVALGKPVIVHCRRLFHRTLVILREEKTDRVGGIMHAFSGSPEMAREFIRLGFLISISGAVTWQGAVRPVKLAHEIPLDNLVMETDAPDLTPLQYRGQPNQPAWLREILVATARIRGMLEPDLAQSTVSNFQRLFGKIFVQ